MKTKTYKSVKTTVLKLLKTRKYITVKTVFKHNAGGNSARNIYMALYHLKDEGVLTIGKDLGNPHTHISLLKAT